MSTAIKNLDNLEIKISRKGVFPMGGAFGKGVRDRRIKSS